MFLWGTESWNILKGDAAAPLTQVRRGVWRSHTWPHPNSAAEAGVRLSCIKLLVFFWLLLCLRGCSIHQSLSLNLNCLIPVLVMGNVGILAMQLQWLRQHSEPAWPWGCLYAATLTLCHCNAGCFLMEGVGFRSDSQLIGSEEFSCAEAKCTVSVFGRTKSRCSCFKC